jgi:flagellar export protein FliJ
MDMRTLRLGAGAALHAVRLARQTVLQLAGLNRRLEAARVRLLEATKRRRALELLRQRRHAQWKAALDKAETAALDDLAATAAARTSRPDPGLRP